MKNPNHGQAPKKRSQPNPRPNPPTNKPNLLNPPPNPHPNRSLSTQFQTAAQRPLNSLIPNTPKAPIHRQSRRDNTITPLINGRDSERHVVQNRAGRVVFVYSGSVDGSDVQCRRAEGREQGERSGGADEVESGVFDEVGAFLLGRFGVLRWWRVSAAETWSVESHWESGKRAA